MEEGFHTPPRFFLIYQTKINNINPNTTTITTTTINNNSDNLAGANIVDLSANSPHEQKKRTHPPLGFNGIYVNVGGPRKKKHAVLPSCPSHYFLFFVNTLMLYQVCYHINSGIYIYMCV